MSSIWSCHEFNVSFSVNPPPLVNPLERKLPFSISSSSFPQMPLLGRVRDSSSIPPSPQNLSTQRKQIYDNPCLVRREQPSSTTTLPPPGPRDLSTRPGNLPSLPSLESQLMPPPKVIPGEPPGRPGHGSVDCLLSSSPGTMRTSSSYPGPGRDKEDIGKRQPLTIRLQARFSGTDYLRSCKYLCSSTIFLILIVDYFPRVWYLLQKLHIFCLTPTIIRIRYTCCHFTTMTKKY